MKLAFLIVAALLLLPLLPVALVLFPALFPVECSMAKNGGF